MEDLEDELDLRYHRGLKPDVYYRCPTLESLDGALRNELQKNVFSLIPVDIVTEFVFAAASTISIPVVQQRALDALIEPADYMQSITVDYALCRDIDGKDRLKVQRAIARSIIEAVQKADGFKYRERSAHSKEGGDGARLKYVCQDSLQNRDRKNNMKKEKMHDSENSENQQKKRDHPSLPTYDCGGAIHVKFSIQRDAINVVYKHNPIHSSPVNGESNLPALAVDTEPVPRTTTTKQSNGTKARNRRSSMKAAVGVGSDCRNLDLDMLISTESPKTSAKKKRKQKNTVSPDTGHKTSVKKSKTGKELASSLMSQKKAQIRDLAPPLKTIKGRACIRCREKKIKCNEAKPTCDQCKRGLWTCQYGGEVSGTKKRSKNGCINCRIRKRKCTEERPSCAHCLKIDDNCEYADHSGETALGTT